MDSPDKYKPSNNFYEMMTQNFIWGLMGIILGVLVNNTTIFMCNKFEVKNTLMQNIIQLILCSFVLAQTHMMFNYFGWSWQNITPGLFFVSFFFGVQFNIFANIQNTYVLK